MADKQTPAEKIVDRLREEGKVKPIECKASASIGGKVQVVKFNYSEDFHFSQSIDYETEGLTEEEVDALKEVKSREIYADLEPIAQEQVDRLQEMRDAFQRGDLITTPPADPID